MGAAEEGALSEHDFLNDLPVVLSATRLSQPLRETPAAMTIIDREMIRDSGAWDVADLFRLVPGMYVAYNVDKEVVPGHVVSYHGLADPYAKRMQILIDGRSVYTPLFGGPIWSNIPLALDDIERIEVVRGPNAASYGANSFLGVINIITRHPADSQGNAVSFSGGKPGSDLTYRHGGRSENAEYRLTAQWRDDNGYTLDPGRRYESSYLNVFPRSDDKRIRNLSFRSDYRLSHADELQFQFGYSGGIRETGDEPQANPRREKRVASQFESLRWQRDLGTDSQVSLRFYHNRDSLREDSSDLFGNTRFLGLSFGVPSPFDQPLRHVAERFDLEGQQSLVLGPSTRLVWGAGIRQDRVLSRLYLNSTDFLTLNQQSLFGSLEWKPRPELTLNIGNMLEHSDSAGLKASPRIGANYQLTAAQSLRAAVGRAYRNPVLYEQQGNSRWLYTVPAPGIPAIPLLFPRGVPAGGTLALQYILGEESLRPERIDSREIGYRYEFGHGSSVDFKYSHDSLSDLVEGYETPCPPGAADPICALTVPTQSIRRFVNGGSISVDAFEAQWQQHFGERTRLFLTWSSTRVGKVGSLHDVAYDRSTPRHSQTMLLSHQLTANWRGSVAAYRVGAIEAIGATGDSLRPYTRWDARLARQFRWEAARGELALVVQNLGNSHYREFYADNFWGRRTYATLRLEF